MNATAAIANHLNVIESAITEIQEWASVLWVRVKGLGARFVSKKVLPVMDEKVSIKSSDRMSNSGYHRCGKPNWWVRVDGDFLNIPRVRGDEFLSIEVDRSLLKEAKEIYIGCGKAGRGKKHDAIREYININEVLGNV